MRHGLAAVVALVVAVAGCSDPYASEPPAPSPRPVATSSTPALPEPRIGDAVPPVATTAPREAWVDGRATTSPAELARAYAQLVINWDWRTLAPQLERCEALAAGPLRDALARTAETARADESLRRDRTGSRGRAVSVAASGGGLSRELVVVTSEQRLRAGRTTLEGPRAKVYTGTARRTAEGWRMVAWELEP